MTPSPSALQIPCCLMAMAWPPTTNQRSLLGVLRPRSLSVAATFMIPVPLAQRLLAVLHVSTLGPVRVYSSCALRSQPLLMCDVRASKTGCSLPPHPICRRWSCRYNGNCYVGLLFCHLRAWCRVVNNTPTAWLLGRQLCCAEPARDVD